MSDRDAVDAAVARDFPESSAPISGHELLLWLAGRVDDDLLAVGRELVAVGEEAAALELIVATLAAARTALPHRVRDGLADIVERRLGPGPARMVPPGAPSADTAAHRFVADAGAPEAAELIAEIVDGLAIVARCGARSALAWRRTPAGAAPGPLPHPVVLLVLSDPASAEVLAYQVGAALGRAGLAASVEVFVDGPALPPYQRAALAAARALGTSDAPAAAVDPSAVDGPDRPWFDGDGPEHDEPSGATDPSASESPAPPGGTTGPGSPRYAAGIADTDPAARARPPHRDEQHDAVPEGPVDRIPAGSTTATPGSASGAEQRGAGSATPAGSGPDGSGTARSTPIDPTHDEYQPVGSGTDRSGPDGFPTSESGTTQAIPVETGPAGTGSSGSPSDDPGPDGFQPFEPTTIDPGPAGTGSAGRTPDDSEPDGFQPFASGPAGTGPADPTPGGSGRDVFPLFGSGTTRSGPVEFGRAGSGSAGSASIDPGAAGTGPGGSPSPGDVDPAGSTSRSAPIESPAIETRPVGSSSIEPGPIGSGPTGRTPAGSPPDTSNRATSTPPGSTSSGPRRAGSEPIPRGSDAGSAAIGSPPTGPTPNGPTGTGPTGTGPASAGPTSTGPTGTGPTGTGPASAGPTSTGPTGSRPTGSRPTGSRPTGSRPTGSRPTGSRPTGSRPTGTGLTVTGPASAGPTTPTGSSPDGLPAAGSGPVGHAPVEPARVDPARDPGPTGGPDADRTTGVDPDPVPPANGPGNATRLSAPEAGDGTNGHPAPRPAPRRSARPGPRPGPRTGPATPVPGTAVGPDAVGGPVGPSGDDDAPPTGEPAWADQWSDGSWSMPGDTRYAPDPDREPATSPTPTGPPLSTVTPSPVRRTPEVPEDGVAPPTESRPRHRLDAPERPDPSGTGDDLGTAPPQTRPGPVAPEDVLDSRLTPNEQELLRRLQEELAARESGGGSDPAPRNGTAYPPDQPG